MRIVKTKEQISAEQYERALPWHRNERCIKCKTLLEVTLDDYISVEYWFPLASFRCPACKKRQQGLISNDVHAVLVDKFFKSTFSWKKLFRKIMGLRVLR